MKTDCDVIRDLMPLAAEGIASEKSLALVREHLEECPACRAAYEEMKKEESTLRFLKDSVTGLVKELKDEKADITGFEEFKRRQEEEPLEQGFTKEDFLSMKEELERRVLEENKTSDENKKGMSRKDRKERNDEILTLQEQGYSEVEIAKRLGIGLGEVKLVLGVFQ